MLLLSCCATLQNNDPIPEQKPIPEAPLPFDENGECVMRITAEEEVIMPLWYWKKIVRFFIDVKGLDYAYNE